MSQLIITVNKLNKRNSIPAKFPESNGIIGTVNKGFTFDGTEVQPVPNPALGKWFKDRDGSFYWGGGLVVESETTIQGKLATTPIINKDAKSPVKPVVNKIDELVVNPIVNKLNIPGIPVNLPQDFRLGVDVSHYNGIVDWDGIRNAGGSFVFIKTSEGIGARDPKAKANAENARQKGLRIGFYHFCHPDANAGQTIENDATAEANEILDVIEGIQIPDLPIVLDLEAPSTLNRNNYLTWVETFINRIKTKPGMNIIIYGNKSFLEEKLPPGHGLGKYKLWLAKYPDHPDCNKVVCPVGWQDWAIWQYTEKGVIGRNPQMDINILKDTDLF
ncbi:MAG: glycoside hydrolase family 25 protein [Ferruginibacter sp.]